MTVWLSNRSPALVSNTVIFCGWLCWPQDGYSTTVHYDYSTVYTMTTVQCKAWIHYSMTTVQCTTWLQYSMTTVHCTTWLQYNMTTVQCTPWLQYSVHHYYSTVWLWWPQESGWLWPQWECAKAVVNCPPILQYYSNTSLYHYTYIVIQCHSTKLLL